MIKKFFKNMFISSSIVTFLLSSSHCHNSAEIKSSKTGIFESNVDIGTCLIKGTAEYNAEDQVYTLSGSGENMWFGRDAFHFAYNKMKGDFILQFEFSFIGKAKNPHRKVGWMVRNNTQEDSEHINGTVHDDGLTSIQYRKTKGGNTNEIKSAAQSPNIVQFERKGNLYILSTAVKGEELITLEYLDSNKVINDEALVGIFICSHEKDYKETAVIKNVRITIPAPEDFKPYQDYLGSNLEVLDIESGNRKILYTDSGSIQAPNWTIDGKSFIFNGSDGIIYNFNIEQGEKKIVNTGHLVKNNNDHVLSFNGKVLGLSDGTDAGAGYSLIYTVPTEGGTPTLITKVGPSYLHGFSPDAKEMIFTGKRGDSDDYEIYSINIETKVETQLTNSPGLDDGSEYSPDGKYIYFNSVRSGKMQIWRMQPDGSNPEQITNDELNNWFPHVSPDGKWMVYITYGNDVAPGDHPFYKHVSIRLMNLETKETKVLVHFYGGQGSMNTPNWSPDGKKIAFISNTGF